MVAGAPPMIPKEVFLSHSSSDAGFATELTETLRRHGVPVWFSRTNILGAQQWHDENWRSLETVRLVLDYTLAKFSGFGVGQARIDVRAPTEAVREQDHAAASRPVRL